MTKVSDFEAPLPAGGDKFERIFKLMTVLGQYRHGLGTKELLSYFDYEGTNETRRRTLHRDMKFLCDMGYVERRVIGQNNLSRYYWISRYRWRK